MNEETGNKQKMGGVNIWIINIGAKRTPSSCHPRGVVSLSSGVLLAL